MVGILVIDDHWAVREGVKTAIEQHDDLRLVATAPTLAEGLAAVSSRTAPVDVVVLDALLRDGSGIDAIPRIKELNPRCSVLVLSMLDENPHAIRAIEHGAQGYISKGGGRSELVEAIRIVAGGQRYVSPTVGNLLADRLLRSNELSPRESEVVRLYASGHRCGEIAKLLSLSPKTVSAHKANAMKKLGVTTNADLIRWSIDNRMS